MAIFAVAAMLRYCELMPRVWSVSISLSSANLKGTYKSSFRCSDTLWKRLLRISWVFVCGTPFKSVNRNKNDLPYSSGRLSSIPIGIRSLSVIPNSSSVSRRAARSASSHVSICPPGLPTWLLSSRFPTSIFPFLTTITPTPVAPSYGVSALSVFPSCARMFPNGS